MGYSPPGMCLWDPWIGLVDDTYHMFYLQMNLEGTPQEQTRASVGHAMSSDLAKWTPLPTALWPGLSGEWDEVGLQAACFYRDGMRGKLLYTGASQDGRHSLGIAESHDLRTWQKSRHNPVLVAGREFSMDGWRDPYVFSDPDSGRRHVVMVASRDGTNGCLALARMDGAAWVPAGRLLIPEQNGDIESPQLIYDSGLWYAFFTVVDPSVAGSGRCRLQCYTAQSLHEPFEPVGKDGFVLSANWLRGARLVPSPHDHQQFVAIGWLDEDADGRFVGTLSQVMPVVLDGNRVSVSVQ